MLGYRPLIQTVLRQARLVAVHGPWSRAVAFHNLQGPPPGTSGPPQPLWGGASKKVGARFTPPGSFDSLYMAWEPITALLEVQALALNPTGHLVPLTNPWVVLCLEGIVAPVLDLTDTATCQILESNLQEITGSWYLQANPPTQDLGQAAYDSKLIAGIRYPSAKNLGKGNNLVVFPERLHLFQNNFLAVHDPHSLLNQRIGH